MCNSKLIKFATFITNIANLSMSMVYILKKLIFYASLNKNIEILDKKESGNSLSFHLTQSFICSFNVLYVTATTMFVITLNYFANNRGRVNS